MRDIRQLAMARATADTISRRTMAAPPLGMPSRSRRRGASSAKATKIARDSHIGDSWAIPVRTAPSNRSMRKTNANDHAAVRRVRQPMAMKIAT